VVDRAHPTQVAAQVAAVDEAGESELAEGLGPEVVKGLRDEKVAKEMLGSGEPAEPERGRQDLAGAGAVDDMVGGGAWE
jgi:hypothetical protein